MATFIRADFLRLPLNASVRGKRNRGGRLGLPGRKAQRRSLVQELHEAKQGKFRGFVPLAEKIWKNTKKTASIFHRFLGFWIGSRCQHGDGAGMAFTSCRSVGIDFQSTLISTTKSPLKKAPTMSPFKGCLALPSKTV